MGFVVTLEGFTPARRYDGTAWTGIVIEEAASAAGPWTTIDTQTLSPADTDPAQPRTRNFSTDDAVLESGWYRISFTDAAGHIQRTAPLGHEVGLTTLTRIKDYLGIDRNETKHDASLSDSLRAATVAILNYTGRDFGAPNITEARNYRYDGTGILDIDDALSVTAVSILSPGAVSVALQNIEWFAEPHDRPTGVYEWLVLPGGYGGYGGPSPEMGFRWNADTLPFTLQPLTVDVTATFGYPVVPEDVQEAAVWTAGSFYESRQTGLRAHAIESFSESFAAPANSTGEDRALPAKARDILEFYRRHQA